MIIKEKSFSRTDDDGNRLYYVFCFCDDSSDLPDPEEHNIDEGSFAICADGTVYVTDSSRTWQQFA